jgi:hypothetical protein
MLNAIRLIVLVSLGIGLWIGFGAVPARTQDSVKGPPTQRQESPAEAASRQRDARERENAYKNAVKNIPDQKANKDPWAGAR